MSLEGSLKRALVALALGLCAAQAHGASDGTGSAGWNQLPESEKAQLRENYERWKQLSPERKEAMRKRFEKFRSLSPEQRERVVRNYRWFRSLSPEKKQEVRERIGKFRALSPEEKSKRIKLLKERREQRRNRMESIRRRDGSRSRGSRK